jgi:hypothetical protein
MTRNEEAHGIYIFRSSLVTQLWYELIEAPLTHLGTKEPVSWLRIKVPISLRSLVYENN